MMLLQSYSYLFLFYFIGAFVPCNALYGFTMYLKKANYSDVPSLLVKKCGKIEFILLIQVFLAALLIAHEYWQVNTLFAIESLIIGWYEMRWLLSWLAHPVRIRGHG